MKISFDVISDLTISNDQKFEWHGKASSLYCIVAGNISDDISVINRILANLSSTYHCVFYIPGKIEFDDTMSISDRLIEVSVICKTFKNVVLLYNHVCVVDGVALIAATCDYGDLETPEYEYQSSDYDYLKSTVERLQKHKDVQKIVCITGKIPTFELYCGEIPSNAHEFADFTYIKNYDTENKISHWIYSGGVDNNEQTIENITYVCNPNVTTPYYAFRILV